MGKAKWTRNKVTSKLVDVVLDFPISSLMFKTTFFRPGRSHLKQFDKWPQGMGWNWESLNDKVWEVYGVAQLPNSGSASLVGLYASKKKPVNIGGAKFYRLDYIEIMPAVRGQGYGLILVMFVAARALELDCEGILVPALPDKVPWWESLGAEKTSDWNPPSKSLVPLLISKEVITKMKEDFDGITAQ